MNTNRMALVERLRNSMARIGKMCGDGTPPRMSIPVRQDDDDVFICNAIKDAIAALQASEGAADQAAEELTTAYMCGVAHGKELAALMAEAVQVEPVALRARVAELERDGAAIGIELAAKYVDKLLNDFCQDHMTIDPDTGTAEFGRGPKGAAAEEHSNDLAEIAMGIRAIAAAHNIKEPS